MGVSIDRFKWGPRSTLVSDDKGRRPVPHALATGSHLYPGARLLLRSTLQGELVKCPELVITFSDGSIAEAMVEFDSATAASFVRVDDYTTARGTRIPAKSWSVASNSSSEGVTTLVLGQRQTL
jgi:hypothetical protein